MATLAAVLSVVLALFVRHNIPGIHSSMNDAPASLISVIVHEKLPLTARGIGVRLMARSALSARLQAFDEDQGVQLRSMCNIIII